MNYFLQSLLALLSLFCYFSLAISLLCHQKPFISSTSLQTLPFEKAQLILQSVKPHTILTSQHTLSISNGLWDALCGKPTPLTFNSRQTSCDFQFPTNFRKPVKGSSVRSRPLMPRPIYLYDCALGSIRHNDVAKITAKLSEWLFIQVERTKVRGWVQSDTFPNNWFLCDKQYTPCNLTPFSATVITATDAFARPVRLCEPLTTVAVGRRLTIISHERDWYMPYLSEAKAFVWMPRKAFFSSRSTCKFETVTSEKVSFSTTAARVTHIRQGKDTLCPSLRKLNVDDKLLVDAEEGAWLYVRQLTGFREGWVMKEDTAYGNENCRVTGPTKLDDRRYQVETTWKHYIRPHPNDKCPSVYKTESRERAIQLALSEGWAFVEMRADETRGWIREIYLRRLANDDVGDDESDGNDGNDDQCTLQLPKKFDVEYSVKTSKSILFRPQKNAQCKTASSAKKDRSAIVFAHSGKWRYVYFEYANKWGWARKAELRVETSCNRESPSKFPRNDVYKCLGTCQLRVQPNLECAPIATLGSGEKFRVKERGPDWVYGVTFKSQKWGWLAVDAVRFVRGANECDYVRNPHSGDVKRSGSWTDRMRFVVTRAHKCFPGKFLCVGEWHPFRLRSDHSRGNAADFFPGRHGVRAQGAEKRAGKALAEWLVENAEELKVGVVLWRGKVWDVTQKVLGWRRCADASETCCSLGVTKAHFDHVHVSVLVSDRPSSVDMDRSMECEGADAECSLPKNVNSQLATISKRKRHLFYYVCNNEPRFRRPTACARTDKFLNGPMRVTPKHGFGEFIELDMGFPRWVRADVVKEIAFSDMAMDTRGACYDFNAGVTLGKRLPSALRKLPNWGAQVCAWLDRNGKVALEVGAETPLFDLKKFALPAKPELNVGAMYSFSFADSVEDLPSKFGTCISAAIPIPPPASPFTVKGAVCLPFADGCVQPSSMNFYFGLGADIDPTPDLSVSTTISRVRNYDGRFEKALVGAIWFTHCTMPFFTRMIVDKWCRELVFSSDWFLEFMKANKDVIEFVKASARGKLEASVDELLEQIGTLKASFNALP